MKLCGTASRVSTWMLGERQLVARPGELPQFGRMLRNHELLLVGYDVDDEPLRRLVLALRGRLGPGQPVTGASVALVPEDGVNEVARAWFAAHGVTLETVPGDYDIVVAEWLHGLAAAYKRAADRRLPLPRKDEAPLFGPREDAYPGLAPYSEHDARYFCGREAEVQRVQDLLRARPRSRWLVVHGPEDIGKTSFISAGLLPALTPEAYEYEAKVVTVLRVRPGRYPLRDLASALTLILRQKSEVIADRLKAAPHALTDLLVQADLVGVILVVDPLDTVISIGERDEREAFAAALAHAVAHAPDPFLLITGANSERFGELYRLPRLHERVRGDEPPVIYSLAPLDAEQLRRAIRVPATRAGFIVAARLVDRMVADVTRFADAVSPAPGRLMAMIAAALAETFRRSEHRMMCEDGYNSAGRLIGAIDAFAEAVIAPALDLFGEPLVRRLLLTLVETSASGRIIRRAIDFEMLADECPGHDRRAQTRRLLDQIGSRSGANRLLTVTPERVVLVHDALLTDWVRLRRWVAEAQGRLVPDEAPVMFPQPEPERVAVRANADILVLLVPAATRSASPWALLSGQPRASQSYVSVPEPFRQSLDPRFRILVPLPAEAILHPSRQSLRSSAAGPAQQRPAKSPASQRPTKSPLPPGPEAHPTALRRLVLGGALGVGVGAALFIAVAPTMWSAEPALPEPAPEMSTPKQAPPPAPGLPGPVEGTRALQVVDELLDAVDEDPAWHDRVASDLQRHGDEALRADQLVAAHIYFERLLHFRRELVRLHPHRGSDAWDLAVVHLRLFEVSRRNADADAALVHLQHSAEILHRPGMRLADHPNGQAVLEFVDRELVARRAAKPPSTN